MSLTNSYVLYKAGSVKNGKVAMSHMQYSEKLCSCNLLETRLNETAVADTEQRLDITPHFIYLQPGGKYMD